MRVAAPAQEGRANKELVRFLADRLGIGPGSITLVHGVASRHKVVEIASLARDDVLRKLVT